MMASTWWPYKPEGQQTSECFLDTFIPGAQIVGLISLISSGNHAPHLGT